MLESAPSILLRFEGLAVFVGAAGLYADGDYGWLAFLVFLLAPDLGMLGYLANPRVGAATYDVVHTTVLPIALGVARVSRGRRAPRPGRTDLARAHRARPRARVWAQVPDPVQGHAPAARLSSLRGP